MLESTFAKRIHERVAAHLVGEFGLGGLGALEGARDTRRQRIDVGKGPRAQLREECHRALHAPDLRECSLSTTYLIIEMLLVDQPCAMGVWIPFSRYPYIYLPTWRRGPGVGG